MELHHDEQTLFKVRAGLLRSGLTEEQAMSAIMEMQNEGILFREYEKKSTPDTRWRPIDSAGNVAPDPASEPPDDPDEGETGPPEAQG